eukprot:755251-Hanusia_phi.AAC.1
MGDRREGPCIEGREMREGRSMDGDHAAALARTVKATAAFVHDVARLGLGIILVPVARSAGLAARSWMRGGGRESIASVEPYDSLVPICWPHLPNLPLCAFQLSCPAHTA